MTVHESIRAGWPFRLALGSRAAGLTLGATLLATGLMPAVPAGVVAARRLGSRAETRVAAAADPRPPRTGVAEELHH
jgi:hypothetical protein